MKDMSHGDGFARRPMVRFSSDSRHSASSPAKDRRGQPSSKVGYGVKILLSQYGNEMNSVR